MKTTSLLKVLFATPYSTHHCSQKWEHAKISTWKQAGEHTPQVLCCGLNGLSLGLKYLNTWSPVGQTLWKGLVVWLLKGVCAWKGKAWRVTFKKPKSYPVFSLSLYLILVDQM